MKTRWLICALLTAIIASVAAVLFKENAVLQPFYALRTQRKREMHLVRQASVSLQFVLLSGL